MLETVLTIGGSVGGTLVVVLVAAWRLSGDWSETRTEVRNMQTSMTDLKDNIKDINGKCADMTGKVQDLHNSTNTRLTRIETILNGYYHKKRARRYH